MAAPVVAQLQDLISQYSQAVKPQQDILDQQITQNDASGATQTQGIEAAKDTAFNKTIPGQAQNRGALFSGFTPDAEATYTGATYLPALAQLQSQIAATRNNILSKKADLNAGAYTQALTTQQNQQKEADTYAQQQQQLAAQQQQAELDRQQKAALQAESERASAAQQDKSIAASKSAAATATTNKNTKDTATQYNSTVDQAAKILGKYTKDIWLDPTEANNARAAIANLVKGTGIDPNAVLEDAMAAGGYGRYHW